jgi:hypothetical protein
LSCPTGILHSLLSADHSPAAFHPGKKAGKIRVAKQSTAKEIAFPLVKKKLKQRNKKEVGGFNPNGLCPIEQ